MPYKTTIYLTKEQAEKLKGIARKKGYVVKRGPHAGEGSIGKLNQAIAEGKVTVVKLGRKEGLRL